MCDPASGIALAGLAMSGAGMSANNSAQNAAGAASQKAIDEQAKLSGEHFDIRQTTIRDSDARIRELEAQGFDRADAAKAAYTERVGDILETEGVRTGQMRAEQDALVDTAIGASDFATFSDNVARAEAGIGDLAAGLSGDTPDMAGMSPDTQRELQRRNAEITAETMGREARAARLLGTNFALEDMGQALENLRLGSGVSSARFAAGDTLPGDLRSADAQAGAIQPELNFIDKMTGIKSARTEGAVGASQSFEGTMAQLAQQRAAAQQPNTMVGDLLSAGAGALGTYGQMGGDFGFFAPKPTPVKAPTQLRGPRAMPSSVPFAASPIAGIY